MWIPATSLSLPLARAAVPFVVLHLPWRGGLLGSGCRMFLVVLVLEKWTTTAAGVGAVGSSFCWKKLHLSSLSRWWHPAVQVPICQLLWEKMSQWMEVQSISIFPTYIDKYLAVVVAYSRYRTELAQEECFKVFYLTIVFLFKTSKQ